MIIGFTYDLKEDHQLKKDDPEDRYAELDSLATIQMIKKAIEDNGHQVVLLGSFDKLLAKGGPAQVDMVFNIAEGLSGRNRESQVPLLLEYWGIPFVGTDALSLGLTLDKVLAKKIFTAEGIPTPKYFLAESLEDLSNLKLDFPLFVKPRYEGSSKGLTNDALVRDRPELKKRVALIIGRYHQPALIEEFISGKEFSVPIIGNDPVKVYEPVQVKIGGKLELGDLFYNFTRLTSPDLEYVYPARVSEEFSRRLRTVADAAYKAVECRDFGRVDIRTNAKDEIFVLEVNPLPALCLDDIFTLLANYCQGGFNKIIADILDAAIKRNKLNIGKAKLAKPVLVY
jgi:D-alanine-D-alanine ligase